MWKRIAYLCILIGVFSVLQPIVDSMHPETFLCQVGQIALGSTMVLAALGTLVTGCVILGDVVMED